MYNASGSRAKHFVSWTTDGTDTPQMVQKEEGEGRREEEERSPGIEPSQCSSSEWSTQGLSEEHPHSPVSGHTDKITPTEPPAIKCQAEEWGTLLYLIPVEHQTLCCVVSVFVVLKKLTPLKGQEKTFTHIGRIHERVGKRYYFITDRPLPRLLQEFIHLLFTVELSALELL